MKHSSDSCLLLSPPPHLEILCTPSTRGPLFSITPVPQTLLQGPRVVSALGAWVQSWNPGRDWIWCPWLKFPGAPVWSAFLLVLLWLSWSWKWSCGWCSCSGGPWEARDVVMGFKTKERGAYLAGWAPGWWGRRLWAAGRGALRRPSCRWRAGSLDVGAGGFCVVSASLLLWPLWRLCLPFISNKEGGANRESLAQGSIILNEWWSGSINVLSKCGSLGGFQEVGGKQWVWTGHFFHLLLRPKEMEVGGVQSDHRHEQSRLFLGIPLSLKWKLQ